MDAIERNILVRQDHSSFDHISYVQGTNAIPIIFHIKDYTVETGTQARVFVRRADGTIEYDNAAISGNDITVNVKSTMFSVVGDSILQINLLKGSKTLVTFGVTVHVKRNHTYTGSQSEDKTDIFDDVLAEARTAIDAANTAAQNIQNKADNGDFTGSVKIGTVTTGTPGSAASATNTGTLKDAVINFTIPRGYPGASMRMTGAWTEGKQYVNNTSYIDLASYEGSTYGCIQTHTSSSSILPTNTEYWQIVAKKGETGNIENLDSIPITFEEAAERENLESGESLPTGLGKIKKWFSDLKQAAFMNVVNGVTQSVAGQAVLDAAVGKYLDEKKFDLSRVVANRNITEPGFVMDGKTVADALTELNGNIDEKIFYAGYLENVPSMENFIFKIIQKVVSTYGKAIDIPLIKAVWAEHDYYQGYLSTINELSVFLFLCSTSNAHAVYVSNISDENTIRVERFIRTSDFGYIDCSVDTIKDGTAYILNAPNNANYFTKITSHSVSNTAIEFVYWDGSRWRIQSNYAQTTTVRFYKYPT